MWRGGGGGGVGREDMGGRLRMTKAGVWGNLVDLVSKL